MKAITLHAPWATLCVTRQPCDCDVTRSEVPLHKMACASLSMVKRFITSTKPCPPSIIGQRIAIHQAKRKPEHLSEVGEWSVHSASYVDGGPQLRRLGAVRGDDLVADRYERGLVIDLPLGAIVGTATITASLPIVAFDASHDPEWPHVCMDERPDSSMLLYPGTVEPKHGDNISDQLPYGDWTPGRYAWLIEDAAPTTERCPWCGGDGVIGFDDDCRTCRRVGHCDPIPATGRPGWWNWEPTS